jgi:uncharacterized membrane protein YhdT
MKKRILLILGIFLTKLASAQDYSDRLTLSSLLNQIDVSTMVLSVVFIVSFALLFYSLSKMFRGEKGIAGVVSLALSFLIAYGINKSGIDLENLVYDMGMTLETLHIIFPIFIIGLVIIFIVFIFLRTGKKARRELRGKEPYRYRD